MRDLYREDVGPHRAQNYTGGADYSAPPPPPNVLAEIRRYASDCQAKVAASYRLRMSDLSKLCVKVCALLVEVPVMDQP